MMQSATQIGVLLVAAGGGVATYVFTKRTLDESISLGSRKPLALCVAIICFVALVSTGPVIILPFAVLGIVCLLLLIVRFLIRRQIIPWSIPRTESPPIPSRQTTPVVPSIPEQSKPPTPSCVKTPAPSPQVIPLIIHHPNGAIRNGEKS